MKPINKGSWTQEFKKYSDARDILLDRLGMYCSYCEMNISNSPEVEHVIPKSKDGSLELAWANFIISCKYCNVNKSNFNDNRDGYYFPDDDNTAILFVYERNTVTINPILDSNEKARAKNLMDLIKLDRDKEAVHEKKLKDLRWKARNESWDKAQGAYCDYVDLLKIIEPLPKDIKDSLIENTINNICRLSGEFTSSWIQIFKDHSEITTKIIENTKGIAAECYLDGKPRRVIKR